MFQLLGAASVTRKIEESAPPAGPPHPYGTCLHPKRFRLEHRYFILRSRKSQSEHTMNIFYVIGVVVVVLVIAGYFGLHV
ncbi:MAG: hypothetical protein WB037_00175 [Pseudolabrys sp.]